MLSDYFIEDPFSGLLLVTIYFLNFQCPPVAGTLFYEYRLAILVVEIMTNHNQVYSVGRLFFLKLNVKGHFVFVGADGKTPFSLSYVKRRTGRTK